jgi:hypothetical protein
MVSNGVIETATGDLVRCGFCDFSASDDFDSETETYKTDVPHPGKVRGDPDEAKMHRWNGSSWVEVDQPV